MVCKERRHGAGRPTGVVDQQDDLGVQELLCNKQAADDIIRDPPGSTKMFQLGLILKMQWLCQSRLAGEL
jgi:hypothetical protein